MPDNKSSPLKILLAAPRGFCAGVDRAIQIVELALKKYGAPIYVRHEIVHNRYVVDSLKAKGAIFVEELDEIPETDSPVIFSAHGVPKSVPKAASDRKMFFLDATCPLVSKVHVEAERHFEMGRQIILIGHQGHPEVIGTMGQLPEGAVILIETAEDARNVELNFDKEIAYITQTTLSVDDTEEIVNILRERIPGIKKPHKEDICYATTNRQAAVKSIAHKCDLLIVVGATNSSNSMRLVEVAKKAGCAQAQLVQRADDLPWDLISSVDTIGITAGASAPEILVDEIIQACSDKRQIEVETISAASESVSFNLPRELRELAAE